MSWSDDIAEIDLSAFEESVLQRVARARVHVELEALHNCIVSMRGSAVNLEPPPNLPKKALDMLRRHFVEQDGIFYLNQLKSAVPDSKAAVPAAAAEKESSAPRDRARAPTGSSTGGTKRVAFSNETKQPTKKSKKTDAELVAPVSEAEVLEKLAKNKKMLETIADSIDTASEKQKAAFETEVERITKSQQGLYTLLRLLRARSPPKSVTGRNNGNDNRAEETSTNTASTGETEENAQQDEVATPSSKSATDAWFDLLLDEEEK